MIQNFLKDVEDIEWGYGKSMACFFKMFPMKLDIVYLEDLKSILRQVYPNNEKKSKEFNEALITTYRRIIEFFSSGNVLSYKNYDFHQLFKRELRNTSEFI